VNNAVGFFYIAAAYEVGRLIARRNAIMVCGGLGGIMESAARGAAEHGGIVVGIIPGEDKLAANQYCHIVIPTGMGVGRNVQVVRSSDVLIAFAGAYGTLNEISCALALHKVVITMPGAWNLTKIGQIDTSLFKEAHDAVHAVGLALSSITRI
jgi:uncharacterized protein (TIGR00725 family)